MLHTHIMTTAQVQLYVSHTNILPVAKMSNQVQKKLTHRQNIRLRYNKI
jgi:hypothetical protein